jgi:hypothetical protein
MDMREGETVDETQTEFRGYGPAADYLGLKRNTLSSYVARGIGPAVDRREVEGQYNLPVFKRDELDRWKNERPGQGARTDLVSAAA